MTSKKKNHVVFWLALMITSYFFCLPIGTFSFLKNTNARLFDIVSFFVLLRYVFSDFKSFYKRSLAVPYANYGYCFILIAGFGLIVSYICHFNMSWMLIWGVRYYRLVVFFLSGLMVIVFVNNWKDFRILFIVFFINCFFQALIGSMQTIGWIGNLSNEGYLTSHATGTLSGHHKHIGIVMLLLLSLSVLTLRVRENLLLKAIALVSIGMAILVIVGAHSRTAYGGVGVYFACSIIMGNSRKMTKIVVTIISVVIVSYFFGASLREEVEYNYHEQVKMYQEEGIIVGNLKDRIPLWEQVPNAIVNYPHIIVIGTGFQNIYDFFPATGGHNNYLHVFMELGVFGFFIFMLWLFNIYRSIKRNYRDSPYRGSRVFAQETLAIFMAILATMLVGETIYAQRAMLSLAGQITVFFAFASHPLWRTSMDNATSGNRSKFTQARQWHKQNVWRVG